MEISGKIVISGDAVIDSAAEIHQKFLDARENNTSIVLDTAGMTSCDVSFLQLLGSLCRTLGNSGRSIEFFDNKVSEHLIEAVKDAGYSYKEQCSSFANRECLFKRMQDAGVTK